MENFIVSARKYRPQKFEDVVGQAHVAGTLKNALATGQVAHAFLFTGPRGVGKTTCARILARVLNCQNRAANFEACNECPSCRAFNENASFNIIELDAASNNSVDHIRALVEQVRFQPQQGKYKVFIIDEVHMLSNQAFNAFLKTLEEPPPYAIFILATTEKHKIIPTILSRCQIFDFRRIGVSDMVSHLKNICLREKIEADEDALHIIGQKADGALRDALSIFDRISASAAGKKITYDSVIENLNVLDYDYYFQITDALLAEDLPGVLNLFDQIQRKGFEPDTFVIGLAEHLRNILVCKDEATLNLLEVGDNLRERYRRQAALAPASFILSALSLANDCDVNYKMARNKRLHVETFLIKLTFVNRAVSAAKTGGPIALPEKKTPDLNVSAKNENTRPETGSNLAAPVAANVYKSIENQAVAQVEEAAPIQVPNQPPPANGLARKLGKNKTSSLSLDAFEAEVEKETAGQNAKISRLNLENAKTEWLAFAEKLDSPTLKMAMQTAELRLDEETFFAKVGYQTQKNLILEINTKLLDSLRESLHHPSLNLQVEIDEEKAEQLRAASAPKKMLTIAEKWAMMKEANPLVQELYERFDLKLEQD